LLLMNILESPLCSNFAGENFEDLTREQVDILESQLCLFIGLFCVYVGLFWVYIVLF